MNKVMYSIKEQSTFILLALSLSFVISLSVATTPSHAINWSAGRIIDNIIFTNHNTMSPQLIQDFLNSKVPTCDTWGTQPSEFGGGTRAQWGTARGTPPPYICLKDYSEGGKSAAQIIYDAAQEFQINPQVLIVLLQKEQGLVTDAWPLPVQYRSATGYGCPDTAPCDSQYYGLTNQIRWSGRMFRAIINKSPTWYTPYVLGNNYIQYNPEASCGGSTVNIENSATQALYNYTPYQPNQAALNAGWGTAPCGAYGNRNFVLYFNNWFGATTNNNLSFSVIQGPNSSNLYLQTSAGKYYILSGALMQAWGIDNLPIQQVSQAYLDSLNTGPNLGKLLKDDWNNYFVVEGGKLHYVRNASYLSLWNVSTSDAVQSLGLAYTLNSDTWLGRFVRDSSQPNGPIWLIDKGEKHLINGNDMLYRWRYTPDQLTTVSTAFLNTIPTNANDVTHLAATTTIKYIIDAGRKLGFSNNDIQHAYYGSQAAVIYDVTTLSFLANETARQFVVNSSTGQWFMLEGGKRHYIQSAELAELWGKTSSTPLTSLSDSLMSLFPDAGNLTNIVQTSSPSMYWVTDGEKHYISNSDIANAWIKPGSTLPVYSTQSLNLLPRGMDATTTINAAGSPYFYIMDAGIKRYLMSTSSRGAWGGVVTNTTRSLVNSIPEGTFLNYIAKNTSGQAYLLMNSTRYLIDPSYYADWGVTNSTPVVADTTISRYALSDSTLRAFIRINNNSYVMVNGSKVLIGSSYDAYQPTSLNQLTLPNDYFNTSPTEATYLARSTNTQTDSVWLVSGGKKHLFNSFAAYVSYGYLSRGLPITYLTPGALSLIPSATEAPGLFIRTANSYGIKFLNFGTSLGFPDGSTLSSLLGSTPVLIVSDSVYNSFPLVGSVSRILKDDAGKIYLVENGNKRWITNGTAYSQYSSIPVTYLYGTTMTLIPNGPNIN